MAPTKMLAPSMPGGPCKPMPACRRTGRARTLNSLNSIRLSLGPVIGSLFGREGIKRSKSENSCRRFEADYQVLDRVFGKGAAGEVREAVCRQTGERYATKNVNCNEISKEAAKCSRREHQIYKVLQSQPHPNLVSVKAMYESGPKLQLVMEKLDGGELFHMVDKFGPLGEEAAAQIIEQLLEVVAHLHKNRVVHRDIKMENIIFEKPNSLRLRLVDFGFAGQKIPGRMLRESYGTDQYAAPEIWRGESYDEKVDIWSVGCTAFMVLTGRVLFRGDDADVARKSKYGQVDFSRSFDRISGPARDLLLSLLTVAPAQRPSAVKALEHPWFQRTRAAPVGIFSPRTSLHSGQSSQDSDGTGIEKLVKLGGSWQTTCCEYPSKRPPRANPLDLLSSFVCWGF